MEKLTMMTENSANENFRKLAELFPNAVTERMNENGIVERAIDKDILMQEISCHVVEGREQRYEFTWPDKRKAILRANSPTTNTLRPCIEESVDFDTTGNLYIEGENLEVLKVLKETYHKKVKMIYIDPPYNTGKDFVYKDNFAMDNGEFKRVDSQVDEEGNRLVQNMESNGRYHTDWLNMMYSRLKVARELLSDDGVIFISIDDNEQANLKKICDEVFGESNFVANLIWRKKTGASDSLGFSNITEYIMVYVKNYFNISKIFTRDKNAHDVNRYKLSDEYEKERGKYYIDNLDRGGIHYSDSLNYPIVCPDGTITYPNGRKKFVQEGWTWTWGREKVEWGIRNGFIEFRKSATKESGWAVCYKNYLKVNNKNEIVERSAPHKNLILDILNTNATKDIQGIFSNKVFQYTKPIDLIKMFLNYVSTDKNSIILDFFSGSATTAHAVMQLNAEDNGNRKFIMVQMPEKCDEKSEAYKAGYANICEIGKERIRRAGKKIKEENPLLANDLDTGFRVLKLDSSNMKEVYYGVDDIKQDLIDRLEDNIKEDRNNLDLLFQVMLNLGITLDSKINVRNSGTYSYYIVGDIVEGVQPDLIACFDKNLNDSIITELAKQKPLYAVFRDNSFAQDDTLTNMDEIFKYYSPDTTRRVL